MESLISESSSGSGREEGGSIQGREGSRCPRHVFRLHGPISGHHPLLAYSYVLPIPPSPLSPVFHPLSLLLRRVRLKAQSGMDGDWNICAGGARLPLASLSSSLLFRTSSLFSLLVESGVAVLLGMHSVRRGVPVCSLVRRCRDIEEKEEEEIAHRHHHDVDIGDNTRRLPRGEGREGERGPRRKKGPRDGDYPPCQS